MSGRPPSSRMNRPPTGGSRRLGTGFRPGTRGSGTPGGGGQSSVFSGTGVRVEDRPMTQHGLSGIKTSAGNRKGTANQQQRQIQDRTYWLGELRSQVNRLTSEMRKVDQECQQKQEENNTFLMFEKRAEILANQVDEIKGELHDYNAVLDRINTSKELVEMMEEMQQVKMKNDRDEDSLERMMEQEEGKMREVKEMEKEVERLRRRTEQRVMDMDQKTRSRYNLLKKIGITTAGQVAKMEEEAEELNQEEENLQVSISGDPLKTEAVRLYEQLSTLQQKKEELEQQSATDKSPEEEQKEVMGGVKQNNQEISALGRQGRDLDEKISKMQEEIGDIESQLDDQESEQTSKFRELQKRDKLIEQFMTSFPEMEKKEVTTIEQLQETIQVLLAQSSKLINAGHNLPSRNELKALKDDLEFKEGELQKAATTNQSLQVESTQLEEDLQKVEDLHEKITKEREFLTEKIQEMEEDLLTYNDLDSLREKAVQRKLDLQTQEEELRRRKVHVSDNLEVLRRKYNDLKKSLERDDTHVQLANQERKLQHLEQTNFAMKEYIANNSADCDQLKTEILKDVNVANKLIQELVATNLL